MSVLPDARIDKVTHWPAGSPGGMAGQVLTVDFTVSGAPFVALNGPQAVPSNATSILISCADQAEVDRLWTALSAGGAEGPCGWLQDKYGFSWQIAPRRLLELITDPDPTRSGRAMAAMMGMKKIVIAEIERAVAGA